MHKGNGSGWSRRRFVASGLAAFGALRLGSASGLFAGTRFDADPFALGVASGDPSADGFVLWTRIAPVGTDAAFLRDEVYAVDVLVAADEHFAHVVRQTRVFATPARAHAVHVEITGLAPDRPYWYRFICGDVLSPVGRTRTLPAIGAPAARLRLALASCQHYEHGYFAAYRHLLADDPDLVVHVGDYIYEGSWGPQVRHHESPRGAETLADYRNRHACYKSDLDLQRAHAACPWLVTWDDHEVSNDYAGEVSFHGESHAVFAARRAAAHQAWLEHMPVRAACRSDALAQPIHRVARFGDLAEIRLLDDRSARTPQACREQGGMVAACAELGDRERTLLGADQRRWLHAGLVQSDARWNVIAQQTLFAPFRTRDASGVERVWTDGWDGYPGERQALLDTIATRRVQNVVLLGGDVHAFYANDLHARADDPESAVIASEFVGTSITSLGDDHDARLRDMPLNPHVRFYDGRWRGYVRCEVTPDTWQVDFRAIDDPADPASAVRTLASFDVESGRPGVVG